jgi:hypothetical protein
MSTETDIGRAKLKGFSGDEFDVEYLIEFTTILRNDISGLPPVADLTTRVRYIRSVNGMKIPVGQYLLERLEERSGRSSEVSRVENLGTGWELLSWPQQ